MLIDRITSISKEGYSPLKNRIYHILRSHPTLSACWGGTSPICHPTGPHQSHKHTKNTTEVTRFSLVVFFLGKEEYSPLQNRICHILDSHPTLSACWGGTSPICHPTGPHQSHKSTKNTTKVTRFSSNLTTYLSEILASIPPTSTKPLFLLIYSAALMPLIQFSVFSLQEK